MAKKPCEICGNLHSFFDSYTYYYNGQKIIFCNDCYNRFLSLRNEDEQIYKPAKEYFMRKTAENTISPNVKQLLNSVIAYSAGDNTDPNSSPETAASGTLNSSSYSEEKSHAQGVWLFAIVGILFLIAALIFYILSISEIKNGRETIQVANIQMTVFAAANFIIANLNFTAAGLLRYLRRKE